MPLGDPSDLRDDGRMRYAARSVSDTDAQEKLGALLDEVAQGTQIAITRQGREIARLVPSDRSKISREEFLRRAAALRARQPKQTSLSEDLIRGDRDR